MGSGVVESGTGKKNSTGSHYFGERASLVYLIYRKKIGKNCLNNEKLNFAHEIKLLLINLKFKT